MIGYLVRRVLSLIPVLIGITVLAFFLGDLAPGDPAGAVYTRRHGEPPTDATVLEEIREELGLDDPLLVRYVRWFGKAARGDLGSSYRSGLPVRTEFGRHLPHTLKLALAGLVAGIVIAFPLGMLAAVYHNSLLDVGMRFFGMLGASMPSFWIGYILILVFSVKLQLLPVAGATTWSHFVLPASVLGIGTAASLSRLLRSSLLEVLRADYIRADRARGIRSWKIIFVHALRPALIPVLTHLGGIFGYLIAGAVIIETVFAIPGIGRLITDAISFRDYPVIQGFVVFTGTIFVAVNLLVDLSYAVVDPRVSLAGRGGQSD
ncbi:MAG TPA: nickel ABC transporter permease [Anaerolineae bacterium]|nr:nickel ABC transporter permease [Anaerolineae bacterium]